MTFYKKLYAIEREAKRNQLSPEARKQWRLTHTQPLWDEFEDWLTQHAPLTLPQSPLGKAMEYTQKRQAGLRRFLEDGRLEPDTNRLEQKNKALALARNNFLFAQSVEGAKALCVHASLIFSALENGHDPYHYYVHIMKALPHCKTVEAIEALLPWYVPLSHDQAQRAVA
jgi:transposase